MAVLDKRPSAEMKVRKQRAPNSPPRGAPDRHAKKAMRNSEIVYRDLRDAIVNVTLPPGAPLVEKEITERYGISRTPVREAMLKLAEERLVDVFPKSGTFVARIPVAVLQEAIVARRALEEVCVREATAKATKSQLMQLQAVIQRERELCAAGDEQAFHDADNAFHAGVAAAGGYPGIWTMIEKIRLQVERYRRLTLPQKGRMKLIVAEHAAVLDAMEHGDADAAVEAMNSHLNKLQIDIETFRDLWPDYFLFDKK
ncbi:GntR family transcriptional regulator [Roseibium marinum]|uniref:DNA-binding GntR family transcriptional regulator n=1 Tax=Roseibium marinum TaxID=281252 RepID=A0A2S3UK35_9HYPH|nr:GntR family transcriptional regulator [Roseibium marinum]POF28021.1 DNA-binding GntR family transcriptional regulator [Roseibium marinum]